MSAIGDLLVNMGRRFGGKIEDRTLPGETTSDAYPSGRIPIPENQTKYLYRIMWVDPDVRAAIQEIRRFDAKDGRVKKIHARTSRAAIKGGLMLRTSSGHKRLARSWQDFSRRLKLNRREKLESDMAGLMMEGNLPLQWVLDGDNRVVAGIRMPAETILPHVNLNGVFKNTRSAYHQYDLTSGLKVAEFALWQLTLARLTPQNYDDMGSMGRPYLDASRAVWRKLDMTEEDLVIRRRQRAPLRTSHVLEGASPEELDAYKEKVEEDETSITTNYYANKKGAVTAVQGDANLDQIADVAHLLDTFFAGSPAPKGIFGYADDLTRDILEDLKKDYYDEIDAMQDIASYAYRVGFELDLLLQGVNPDNFDFDIEFAERRTMTLNQRADLALKYQALGLPKRLYCEAAGLDFREVREEMEAQMREDDPYPEPAQINVPAGRPRVSVTPGNERKGESATTIATRGQ